MAGPGGTGSRPSRSLRSVPQMVLIVTRTTASSSDCSSGFGRSSTATCPGPRNTTALTLASPCRGRLPGAVAETSIAETGPLGASASGRRRKTAQGRQQVAEAFYSGVGPDHIVVAGADLDSEEARRPGAE